MNLIRSVAAALAIAIAAALPALAADLPTKAPSIASSLFNGFPYTGSGFYWGLNSIGGGGSVNASGTGVNPNSVVSNSAALGATIGYSWANWTGSVFYAVEGMFDVQNFNGASQGFAFGGPAAFEQRLKVGTPLSAFLSVFPNNFGLPTVPPFPALPNGAVATNVHPYLMLGLHEDDVSINFGLANNKAWRIAPSVGVGAMGQLTNGVAIDVWAETIFPQNAVCLGGNVACASIAQQYKVGLALLY